MEVHCSHLQHWKFGHQTSIVLGCRSASLQPPEIAFSSTWQACSLKKLHFIALIHPIQWTIAKPVGADRPAKRQKKMSCVSTGWPVPVLCIRQVAHGIYFLSRQHDVIASFSFWACTVQMCFQHLQNFKGKVCFMTDFKPYMWRVSL